MNLPRQKIDEEIRERGPIPFSRYMELCLYDAEFGYYSRNAEQFGKAGDFYTSSDVHAVFGRLLARQFDEMWRVLGSPQHITLEELGPGRGLFARDVLDWSEKKFPDFFRALRYVLVETSSPLRARIEATLSRHFETGKALLVQEDYRVGEQSGVVEPSAVGELSGVGERSEVAESSGVAEPSRVAERRHSLAQHVSAGTDPHRQRVPSGTAHATADADVPSIIFANEFFDALPVEVVSPQGSLRIDARGGRFVETWSPPSPQELEFLDRYSVHPEAGERVEVPLAAQQNMDAITSTLRRGFIVVIDYGYIREEQLAGRHRGTLKAIRQHSVSANPYEAPGEQDITADVNFTALAETAEKWGMHSQRLITQSQFLMGIGEANQFADAFEDCRLPQERTKVALQLKHLVTPAGMGESFHVLVASKGIEKERVAELAGLNFGHKQIAPLNTGSLSFESSRLRRHGVRFGCHFRILIHSAPRLPPQPPRLNVLHQQRRWTIFFSQRLVQIFENVQPRIETHQIHQLKRAHRMVEPKLQRLVDVRRRGDSLLQHVERLVADHRVDAAGDEPGRFLDDYNFFPHALAHFDGSGERVIIRFQRADHFEQLHLMHGIEELHAHALLRAISYAGRFR